MLLELAMHSLKCSFDTHLHGPSLSHAWPMIHGLVSLQVAPSETSSIASLPRTAATDKAAGADLYLQNFRAGLQPSMNHACRRL